MQEVKNILDDYIDSFVTTKELQKIKFLNILKSLKISIIELDTFIMNDSYYFNINAELFNIRNNSELADIKQAYSGFSKPELRQYYNILQGFIDDIHTYRSSLIDNNFVTELVLSGNIIKLHKPSEILSLHKLYIYDIKTTHLHIFGSTSGDINLLDNKIDGATQYLKYKLNVPHYTITKIQNNMDTDLLLPCSASYKLNKNSAIIKIDTENTD